jgi:hypothetical protein
LRFYLFVLYLLIKPTAMVLDREKAEGAAADASSPITTWFVKSRVVTVIRKVMVLTTACLIEKPPGAANGIFISGSFGGELLPPGDGFTGPG